MLAGAVRRRHPEEALQRSIAEYLDLCLPPEILWTASMVGVSLNRVTRGRMRGMGVRPGWPDLQFLFPDGVTRYIELKAGAGLSTEQRRFRDVACPQGVWALCRSLDDVKAALRGWGAQLRDHDLAA